MNKVRTFLVGLGAIGMGYDFDHEHNLGITHARATQMHPNFDLVGAFDKDELKRRKFELKYPAPIFDKLQDGIRATCPDMVVVAVPTEHHLDVVRSIIETWVPQIILCEKPLAYTTQDASEIMNLTQRNGVSVFVNYFRNSDPEIFEIRNLIEKKIFLQPFEGRCLYSKGTLNTASHFLNLLDIIFGMPIALSSKMKFDNDRNELDPNRKIDLEYQAGQISLEPVLENSKLVFNMEIKFQNGKLLYLNEGSQIEFHGTAESEIKILRSGEYNSNDSRYQYDVFQEIANFMNRKPYRLCSGNNALRYVQVLNFD